MKNMGFRWFGKDNDPISLANIRQIPGTTQVVGALTDIPVGEVWPQSRIKELKKQINSAGLKFEVVESVNVHDDIKIGLPSRDRYIENYKQTIKNLSENGIKVICYNFMPIFDWTRTTLKYPLTDGANVMAFEQNKIATESPEAIIEMVQNSDNHYYLPGWEPKRLKKVKQLFNAYQGVDEQKLRENLKYFLDAVIPTCEKYDVRLAIHPDDPPRPLFGLPRIYKNQNDMQKISEMNKSKYNGFTICTGSLGENPYNDVPAIIRKFVPEGRVPFVHVRNIKFLNDEGDFRESAHWSPEGSLDMFEIMKALHDTNYSEYIRPDHGRNIWGEDGRPGYGLYDRALGISYLTGLWEAIEKQG